MEEKRTRNKSRNVRSPVTVTVVVKKTDGSDRIFQAYTAFIISVCIFCAFLSVLRHLFYVYEPCCLIQNKR